MRQPCECAASVHSALAVEEGCNGCNSCHVCGVHYASGTVRSPTDCLGQEWFWNDHPRVAVRMSPVRASFGRGYRRKQA